jgi:uncharacterized protein (TIGR03083 family)
MTAPLDYLGHLARESARFAAVMDGADPGAPVPSCPGWTAADLVWHLGEVQWFWGTIVRDRVNADTAEQLKPPRPAQWPGLMEFYRSASAELDSVLAITAPETTVWTWADDKTAGFVRRRQAHEALIHRVDAELTVGDRSPLDPVLSADGVDEALRIIFGGDLPAWGMFTPDEGSSLRMVASDTGDIWMIRIGVFTGTDPDSGQAYDQRAIQVIGTAAGAEPAAAISGTAGDLDCWLWGRPGLGPVTRSGDEAVLGDFDAVIAEGVN